LIREKSRSNRRCVEVAKVVRRNKMKGNVSATAFAYNSGGGEVAAVQKCNRKVILGKYLFMSVGR
jgi:hypothetical protein